MNAGRTLKGHRRLGVLAAWRRGLARNVWDNPVTRKELRGKMRTGQAFITLSAYVAFLSLVLLGFYAILADSFGFNPATGFNSAAYNTESIGGTLFGVVVGMELLLIGFTVPNLTSGAISGERERQTYDLLRVTLLPAHTLVVGKLAATLAYVGLLLLVAVPLQSVAFFFGGISAMNIALSLWVMTVEALFLAALGLYFSARARRTFSAKALTYGAMIFLAFGLPLVGGVMTVNVNPSTYQPPSSGTVYVAGTLLSLNPALVLLITHAVSTQSQSPFTFSYTPLSGTTQVLPLPWVVFSVLYLGMTALLLRSTVRRVRRVEG